MLKTKGQNMHELQKSQSQVPTIGEQAKVCAAAKIFGNMNESQIATLMLMAQAEGKHPMQAMQEYDIIQNRPALKSSAVLGRFINAGGKIEWLESTDTKAVCKATYNESSATIDWDIERAKKAGVYGKGGAWLTYPRAMLRARAQVEAVRAIAPQVLSGLYCAEEVEFFDAPKSSKQEPIIVNAEYDWDDVIIRISEINTMDELKQLYKNESAKSKNAEKLLGLVQNRIAELNLPDATEGK